MKFPTLEAMKPKFEPRDSNNYRITFIRKDMLVKPQLWKLIGNVVAVDTSYDFSYGIHGASILDKTTQKVISTRYTAYYSCPASAVKPKATGMYSEDLGKYDKASDARKAIIRHFTKKYNKNID